jgi:crotonobetainyl-CoA:carnitine CoA-transferase CaiB-like acyl-CoA transferase
LENAVAAPLCTRHLADLGAEVIKVERPGEGDFARGYDTFVVGLSGYFVWLNRGKKSLTLDIKHAASQPVLDRLVESADIVVQNLAPGAASRRGLSYETLRTKNPRIISVDISGYGEGGPFASKKAYDMLIQAESGLISITGSEAEPSRVGISVVDMSTALYAQAGTLTALIQRGRTGVGSNVKVSMLDAIAEWMTYPLYRHGYDDSVVARSPLSHTEVTPYGAHATKDGQVIFSIQNEREWRVFCREALGDEAIACDPRFRTNSVRRDNVELVTQVIENAFADKTSLEVVALLDRIGIANGRLNSVADLWDHAQLSERDRWRTVNTANGSVRALLPPFTFSDFEAVMGDVPALGAHTEAILESLDFNKAEISQLQSCGAV